MNPNGTFIWALSIPMVGIKMILDPSENIYLAGRFSGNVDLDPGLGVFNATATNTQHALILKLNSNGNFLWAKSFGGTGVVNSCWDIVLDNNGNIFTTGRFEGTTDFDSGSNTFNLTANGSMDVFVHKMDWNGNFLWAKTFGGIGLDYGFSIAVDALGNVYTTGTFTNTVDFDPGSGLTNLTSLSGNNVFIQKLNQNGVFVWAKAFGANLVNAIKLDESDNVFTIGNFQNTVDFDPGSGTYNISSPAGGATCAYLQKLDVNGNFLWAKNIGASTSTCTPKCFEIHSTGNIYIAGSFSSTTDFDPTLQSVEYTSAGSNDIFISKLNTLGNFEWVITLGGTFIDYPNSICVMTNETIIATGVFSNSLDFDPGPGASVLSTNGNTFDVFVLKLNQCINSSSIDTQFSCGPFTWIDGIIYSSDNNTATYVIDNPQGCDSTITLNLTISQPTSSSQTQSAIDSYTWPVNGQTYTESGIYSATIPNAAGCDSTITLNLTLGFSGIMENEVSKIIIYPNPTENFVSIEVSEELIYERYILLDFYGRIILEGKFSAYKNNIDMSKLSKGTYLLKVNDQPEIFNITKL
jgi:hypothetical protein